MEGKKRLIKTGTAIKHAVEIFPWSCPGGTKTNAKWENVLPNSSHVQLCVDLSDLL